MFSICQMSVQDGPNRSFFFWHKWNVVMNIAAIVILHTCYQLVNRLCRSCWNQWSLEHGTTLFGGKLAHEYLIRFWISENQTQPAVARKIFQTTTEINRSFLKSPCQFSAIFLTISVSWDVLMYKIRNR